MPDSTTVPREHGNLFRSDGLVEGVYAATPMRYLVGFGVVGRDQNLNFRYDLQVIMHMPHSTVQQIDVVHALASSDCSERFSVWVTILG